MSGKPVQHQHEWPGAVFQIGEIQPVRLDEVNRHRPWSETLRLPVDEPAQLDRGVLTRDVEHVKTAGPPVKPRGGRPGAFGQMAFSYS